MVFSKMRKIKPPRPPASASTSSNQRHCASTNHLSESQGTTCILSRGEEGKQEGKGNAAGLSSGGQVGRPVAGSPVAGRRAGQWRAGGQLVCPAVCPGGQASSGSRTVLTRTTTTCTETCSGRRIGARK